MITVIIAVPRRLKYATKLEAECKSFSREVVVLVDEEYNGCNWNSTRAIETGYNLAKSGEDILILTDDAILCKNFEKEFNKLRTKTSKEIISLGIINKHLAKEVLNEDVSDVFITSKFSYFCDHGFVINKSENTKFLLNMGEWLNTEETNPIYRTQDKLRRKGRHFDQTLSLYIAREGIKWAVAVPTLVKHNIEISSILGHRETPSYLFIDEE